MPNRSDGAVVKKCLPVYEVVSGQPSWSSLVRLASEAASRLSIEAVVRSINKGGGRSSAETNRLFSQIRSYLQSELPPVVLKDVLNVCLARDRFRCHHNPTDCLSLELWRVFFSNKFTDVNISHHAFAFPKTTNYPDIVSNLEDLLSQMSSAPQLKQASSHDNAKGSNNNFRRETRCFKASCLNGNGTSECYSNSCDDKFATITSFKLELKQCEVGCLLQNKIIQSLASLSQSGLLRVLEIPGLGSDELLYVIAKNCTNLEVLNVKGSRELVGDEGIVHFIDASKSSQEKLRILDVSRCSVTQNMLSAIPKLRGLKEFKFSSIVLDELSYSCDGQFSQVEIPNEYRSLSVGSVTIESEHSLPVNVHKVMDSVRSLFPSARNINLTNCIACELHVTLTQQPPTIGYMREYIHTLDLVSADYFHFPRMVYPCPNLEFLHIEKPTNDIFNIDATNIPFLYANTVPFVNLRNLRLSRISLTNLSHFLSKSSNLRNFKVTNIGRRERPRWTDERIKQILDPLAVPRLEEFHVSCLPNEGFSTVEIHRCLHLTKVTIQYLAENFHHLKRIAGIESWTLDCSRETLNSLLNSDRLGGRFSVVSL